MINKRFEIAFADLNIGDPIILDIEIVKTILPVTGDLSNTDTRYLYPQQIQVINDCGAGVEWLSVSNEEEYAEYVADPSLFTFVRLPIGFTLQDDFTSFGRCYKFIIRAYELTATTDLTLEFINYRTSLR